MGHHPIGDHRLVGVKPDKPVVEPGMMSPSAPSFLDVTDRNDICRWAMRRCAERTAELCASRTCSASRSTWASRVPRRTAGQCTPKAAVPAAPPICQCRSEVWTTSALIP